MIDAAGDPNPALQLRHVSVRFGGVRALDDVSLHLPARPGISAIIGPNGAGKTTLFNVLTGLVRPASGHLLVGGREMTGRRPDEIFRARIARTFQGVRLFEHLSVRENVHLAARSACATTIWFDRRRIAWAATERALTDVALETRLWSALPEQLTLLERRLTEIARALAGDPIALLLDEPAAGLNTAEKERLSALLRTLSAARNCRVVIVEHDVKLVMALAERILVMNFGGLLSEGPPEAIRCDPAVIEAYLGTGADHA